MRSACCMVGSLVKAGEKAGDVFWLSSVVGCTCHECRNAARVVHAEASKDVTAQHVSEDTPLLEKEEKKVSRGCALHEPLLNGSS